ncbi:Hypothetical protein PHPALM_7403 [Phytophthora palmivora]|uniref:Uncharacterized protein n=1 Tax=Phytophthora palmivora TaxID=4796 RepID=A0A2P4YCF9_9STRA|nr:Hypothetical protein PHPALM_7403 [Phytophthora palmivora]
MNQTYGKSWYFVTLAQPDGTPHKAALLPSFRCKQPFAPLLLNTTTMWNSMQHCWATCEQLLFVLAICLHPAYYLNAVRLVGTKVSGHASIYKIAEYYYVPLLTSDPTLENPIPHSLPTQASIDSIILIGQNGNL